MLKGLNTLDEILFKLYEKENGFSFLQIENQKYKAYIANSLNKAEKAKETFQSFLPSKTNKNLILDYLSKEDSRNNRNILRMILHRFQNLKLKEKAFSTMSMKKFPKLFALSNLRYKISKRKKQHLLEKQKKMQEWLKKKEERHLHRVARTKEFDEKFKIREERRLKREFERQLQKTELKKIQEEEAIFELQHNIEEEDETMTTAKYLKNLLNPNAKENPMKNILQNSNKINSSSNKNLMQEYNEWKNEANDILKEYSMNVE